MEGTFKEIVEFLISVNGTKDPFVICGEDHHSYLCKVDGDFIQFYLQGNPSYLRSWKVCTEDIYTLLQYTASSKGPHPAHPILVVIAECTCKTLLNGHEDGCSFPTRGNNGNILVSTQE